MVVISIVNGIVNQLTTRGAPHCNGTGNVNEDSDGKPLKLDVFFSPDNAIDEFKNRYSVGPPVVFVGL